MPRLRSFLGFLFGMVCLLAASTGRGQDQPKNLPLKTDPAFAELQKKVESLRGELESAKKNAESANKKLAELTSQTEAALKASQAATAEAGKAVKAAAMPPMPPAGLEELKKSIEANNQSADETKKKLETATASASEAKDKADTAWMLISSALVMFMIPGLALFYGGMVRRKNMLATMMQSMACLAVVGLYWLAVGYSLAFGPSVFKLSMLGQTDAGLLGWSWDLFFLKGINTESKLPGLNVPIYLHVMFQGMFAIITPALISGAIAERIRFWPFCIFCILWVTFVYCPLAHMVWAFDWFDISVEEAKRGASAIGLLGKMGALDFAGGTVVHIAAGIAGLAACLVLRRRDGYPKSVIHPSGMVLTLLGAGFLWFGWFGFNGGSSVASNALAVSAFAATQAAAAAAGLGWMVIEWLHKGKPTALGLASGIVAGLVAVTPASGFVYIWGAIAIGFSASLVCYLAVWLKAKLGYDDSLDAFGVHGVGGFVGAVLTGLFCYASVNSAGSDGFFALKGQAARLAALEGNLVAEAEKAAATEKDAAKKATLEQEATKLKDELAKLKDQANRLKDLEPKLIPEARKAAEAEKDPEKKKELDSAVAALESELAKSSPLYQFVVQLKASLFSVVFALVLSLALVLLTQALTLGHFTTSKEDETEGLDRTEHGEVGFDFGYATESVASSSTDPVAASRPKINGRFELLVEGAEPDDIAQAWTSLCQPSDKPADPNFVAVYPHVTTFSGNSFRCRGENHPSIAAKMEALFKKTLPGKPIRVIAI